MISGGNLIVTVHTVKRQTYEMKNVSRLFNYFCKDFY